MLSNREKYLSSANSPNGGRLDSDFIKHKQDLFEIIKQIRNALAEHCPAFDEEKYSENTLPEAEDPAARDKQRENYISHLDAWRTKVHLVIKKEEEFIRALAEEKEEKQTPLLDRTPFLSMQQIEQIKPQLHVLKGMTKSLRHTKRMEDCMTVTEIRLDRNKNPFVVELKYDATKGVYEHEEKERKSIEGSTLLFKIVHGRRYQDDEKVVTPMTKEEYAAFQRLGGTRKHVVNGHEQDRALTAQLINEYGVYFRKVLYAFMRRREQTDTRVVKLLNCQLIFQRLTALQKVESAYGGSIDELKKQLDLYRDEIKKLHLEALEKLKRATHAPVTKDYTKENKKWLTRVLTVHCKGLTEDLNRANEFANEIDLVVAKHPGIDTTLELYKPENDPHDTGLTGTSVLGRKLRSWVKNIDADGSAADERVDISGKKSISKGQFSTAAAKASRLTDAYEFPLNGRMSPILQGIHEGLRDVSSADLATGQRDTRDILFALACVKSGLTDFNDINALLAQMESAGLIDTVSSRGWRRMLCCTRVGQKHEIDREINAEMKAGHLSVDKRIYRLYDLLRDNVQASTEKVEHAVKEVGYSICEAMSSTASHAWKGFKEVTVNAVDELKRDYGLIPEATEHKEEAGHSVQAALAAVPAESKEHVAAVVNFIQEIGQHLKASHHPEYKVWDPHTAYSILTDFLKHFGGFFVEKYKAAPLIWMIGTVIGAVAGAAPVDAPAIKSLLLKLGLGESSADYIIEKCIDLAVATTKSEMFQVVGNLTTVQQVLALLMLETLAEGADSSTIQALAECKRNLPVVAAVLFGSTGFGWTLSQFITFFKDDLGSKPFIAEFFSGLKVLALGYEATLAPPGEKSALANTLTDSLNLGYNGVRVALSAGQLFRIAGGIITCDSDLIASGAKGIARPLKDIAGTVGEVAIATVDAACQISATLGQGVYAVTEATVDASVNTVAKVATLAAAVPCLPSDALEGASDALIDGKWKVKKAVDQAATWVNDHTTRTVRDAYQRYSEGRSAHREKSMFQPAPQRSVEVAAPEPGPSPDPFYAGLW